MAEEVLAPLAGNICEINVQVGDAVEEDDDLLVIEALKMENIIYAPCDGKISEIKVGKGEQVEEDQVLVIIEPD